MSPDLPSLYQLGIVGSGQIARMTHQAAVKLGIVPRLFAEGITDSAALASPDTMVSHPDTLGAFADSCAVLTFEHERVDVGLLEQLEASGTIIRPGSKTIRAAFDKIHQRRVLLNRGIAVPVFAELRGPDDVLDFTAVYDWPIAIKSVKAGRPGERGVWIVSNQNEALRVITEQRGRDLMVENYQPIVTELVVLVVRRPGGHARTYPVIEQIQHDGMCRELRAPAAIGVERATEARDLALRIADELDAVGVLAVELFLTSEGLIVNELAARPHNAGHLTIEASPTSQFENHVRAVLDLPLGPTWLQTPAAVTVNVIGGLNGIDPAQHLADALAVEGAQIHLYGKRPAPGVKLGHVTATADDLDTAHELARRAESALMGRRFW